MRRTNDVVLEMEEVKTYSSKLNLTPMQLLISKMLGIELGGEVSEGSLFDKLPPELLVTQILPKLTPASLSGLLCTQKRYYGLMNKYNAEWRELATSKLDFLGMYKAKELDIEQENYKAELAKIFMQMAKYEAEDKSHFGGEGNDISCNPGTMSCCLGVLFLFATMIGGLASAAPHINFSVYVPVEITLASLTLLLLIGSCIYHNCYSCRAENKDRDLKTLEAAPAIKFSDADNAETERLLAYKR